MKFSKTDLRDLIYEQEADDPSLIFISTDLIGTSRWSNIYSLVFKEGDKYYQVIYSTGATEMQDERPFEYEGEEIECLEVVPVQKTVTSYKRAI